MELSLNSMPILSNRSSFLAFCLGIAFLTMYLINSSCLQTGKYSTLTNNDINVNVYLHNYTLQNPETEFRDGKLVITYEIQTQSKERDETAVKTNKLKTKFNQTTTSESIIQKVESPNIENVTFSSTQSSIPETRKIFPLTIGDSPYNINNTNICEGIKDILFLVLVHTATDHFTRRQSYRETWANVSLYQTHKMRIVFLLGLPNNESLQANIEDENNIHGDIVQGNFIDSYRNLTHKGVMGLRWVKENCKQAKFIVKIDDDMFVNTLLIIENVLVKHLKASRMIIGRVQKSARIKRNGKWKVDEHEFFKMARYPFPYCMGYFVILTSDIIEQLYEAAKVTPFFWIDDVYLFGILPDKVRNITFLPLKETIDNEHTAVICYISREKPCGLVAAYAYNDGVIHNMWQWACEQNKKLVTKYVTANGISA